MESNLDFCAKYAPDRKGELLGEANQRIVAKLIRHRPQKKALVTEYGGGKTAITHQVAAGFNCQADLDQRPCGGCEGCVYTYHKVRSSHSIRDRAPGGAKFWMLDTTRVGIEVIRSLSEDLTIYADPPELVVMDEFQNASEEIQQPLLKLLELKTGCTFIFCFARFNAHHLTKALLQRLSPPLTPVKPAVEEFYPLIERVLKRESIQLVDQDAPKLLVNVCGRVPRLVLKALEEVKVEEQGLSIRVVEAIAAQLSITGEGKERTK